MALTDMVLARRSRIRITRSAVEETTSVWCQVRLERSTNPNGDSNVSPLDQIMFEDLLTAF
jgi:hypothetical protein